MTHVSTKDRMPEGSHYVIITFDSIYIPGDERSRTNPGHGYPAHTQSIVKYQAFTDREEWEQEIKNQEANSRSYSKPYIAGYFTPALVEQIVKIAGVP